MNVSFSKTVIGVLITAVAAVAAADCSDKRRSPTAPETGAAAITIDNGTTTATKRTVVQGPFTYTVSSTLRETSGVGATISQVTATVTDNSGVATATQIAPDDAFGTTRIQANGTLTSTGIVVMGSLATASNITVRVAFVDDHGNTGSPQASAGVEAEFTGAWSGPTTITQPPGDWSVITMSLVQNGDALTGEVITRDGRHFPVTGCAFCEETPARAVVRRWWLANARQWRLRYQLRRDGFRVQRRSNAENDATTDGSVPRARWWHCRPATQ